VSPVLVFVLVILICWAEKGDARRRRRKRQNSEIPSQIRQNFHEETEEGLNKQINMEFHASLVYLSMSCWFNRDDQALHGFASFFKKASNEERDHGVKLMDYQTSRGGRCQFEDIEAPVTMEWGTPLHAMKEALALEKTVNQHLLDLHSKAGDMGDAHLCDFLDSHFLTEQVDGIKQIGDMITKLERADDGIGVHIIDKELKDDKA